MKKVFAFLSVFALTIAFVGFGAKAAKAADLWVEDPTLGENEIPMYIMDSIYSTFPQYYDNATKADGNWAGAARMYPWNETRLQVKQIDAAGNFTGKEYAIYFAGALTGESSGTGNNVLFYTLDDAGQLKLGRMSNGKWDKTGVPMDPSLSHMRTNVTGQDIAFDAIELWSANNSDNGGNMYNRMLVFDGQGRMVRGISGDGAYLTADAEGVLPGAIAPEYCYVNGTVEKIEEGTVCDVETIEIEGSEETKEVTKYITNRFVWQYFDHEDFDPATVNEVAYLSEGWDAQKWDYAIEEADGYVCIAFVSGEGSNFKLRPEQLEVYTATCEANGLEAPDANTTRKMARTIIVPAGGMTYDFGYLDKGLMGLYEKYNDMCFSGYKYGRTLDEEGKGMGYNRGYDFSAKPLYYQEKALNGVSYQLLEGQNVVEVLQGESFNPASLINYSGLAKYWGNPYDLTSFQSDASVIDLYIVQDGLTVVQPSTGYTSFQAVVDDFLADVAAWKGVDVSEIKFDTAANFQSNFSWGQFFATNADNANKPDYPSAEQPSFWNVPAHREKWTWLIEEIYATMLRYPGGDTYTASLSHVENAKNAYYCGSPQTIAYAIWYFLNGQEHGYFGFHFQDGHNSEWLDPRTNAEKWAQHTIDTSKDAINTNYDLTFKAYNTVTNISSEYSVKFVVVDEYTPILNVNKNNLRYSPKVENGKLVINAIDEYTLCSAYDARYNGKAIKGNNISYKVHYTSETLDFDKPTEGKHLVKAVVYNQTKYAEKEFVVIIEDMTAPVVYTQDYIKIGVGEYFNLEDGITYAYDAVDGNLLDHVNGSWYLDISAKKLDVTKAGKYEVVLEVWDSSDNVVEVSYIVEVVSLGNEDLEDAVAANKQAIDELYDLVADGFDDLNEAVEALKPAPEAEKEGCGSSATVTVQLLAAASLLVVFLRKRH